MSENKKLTFTIITPTLLRSTLTKACESIHNQDYLNWRHLIVVDDPVVNLDEFLETNQQLLDPRRFWFQCDRAHHNVGNTCRSKMYDRIHPKTNYVLYLDDDNYYLDGAFHLLNKALQSLESEWGIFPMIYLGKLFLHSKPRRNYVDTNQIFHKPIVKDNEVRYLAVDEYFGDGLLVEWLTKLVSPTVLTHLPPLVEMPVKSYGAPLGHTSEPYVVVIPNRFDDVIKPLLDSIEVTKSKPNKVVIVADGHDDSYGHSLVEYTQENFIYSKAANEGIKAAGKSDVILLNDDVRLTSTDTFNHLYKIAYSDPSIGILSPVVNGGCGNLFMDSNKCVEMWNGQSLMYRPGLPHDYISFVCVYIKRQLLDEIGLMDENFTGYGRDDADMCIRAARAGWKLAITRSVRVTHGIGGSTYIKGKNWNSSYHRRKITAAHVSSDYFYKKYPDASKIRLWPQPYSNIRTTKIIRNSNEVNG